ncbi:MAG: esterase family protein [Bacteroidetes bacterium]|nr:esterase family protein [Bacteroidota bacterium]
MNFWTQPIRTVRALLKGKAPHVRQIRHWPSRILQREVDFDVYLPPDYHRNPQAVYPLVLFNDGQDLPRMEMSHILEQMYRAEAIPYLIVVGIYANFDRIREYGTARQPDYKGRGDKAALYRDFIMTEMLPLLNRRFRLSGERSETVFAGFSLGALSAFDIAWEFQSVFGGVGVFSGALWWRWTDVIPDDPDANRIMLDIVLQTREIDTRQRFWFECGTLDESDDRNNNGRIDAIDDTYDMMEALQWKGIPPEQMHYLEIPDGEHTPETWGQAMPDFLCWMFPRNT